jgi:broad specificity phosphatase PhoE
VKRLILIRHSVPDIRRDTPAAQWRLSADGVTKARALARSLEPTAVRVFTSVEPKAVETARALADEWGLETEEAAGLHEHERPHAQMLTREEFERRVRELFSRPAEVVFGAESADEARRRFTMAVMRLIARTDGDVVVVTHGTVLTLFVAETTGVEPFAFWKKLSMPCAVVLRLPELTLESIRGESTTHRQRS